MKIGILGTGNVARKNYLPFLARQDDVDLVYQNRTREKAAACADEFGGEAVDTVEELVARDPDAIMILTRETDRYDAAMAALTHSPRRVFFEKPLVALGGQADVTEDDFLKGREVMRRAREAGTETAMVFNYRFFDQTLAALRIVEERGFGSVYQVTGLVHYACWSHCIDLVRMFAGRATEMMALTGKSLHKSVGMEAPDVTASFLTDKGASGAIIGTSGLDFKFPIFELTFGFAGGRISFRGLDGEMEVLDHAKQSHERYAISRQTSRWDQYNASFEKVTGAYLDSIRQGMAPPVPGLAGLEELQFEAALRRSSREGRAVDVQSEFPLA